MCQETSPILYTFGSLISAFYWIMFILCSTFLVKIKLNQKENGGGGGAKSSGGGAAGGGGPAAVTEEVGSEGWFKGIFEEVSDDMKAIDSDKVASLLSQLGMNVTDDDVSKIIDDYDEDGVGEIAYSDLWAYYQKSSGGGDDKNKDD